MQNENYDILIILENFYGYRKGRLSCPVYRPHVINHKNATYSRLIPYFKDTPFILHFGETTPNVATNKDTKFPIDVEWVKRTVEYRNWFAIISCCKKSDIALEKLGIVPFISLPHPTSFKWRKVLIEDCVKKLCEKLSKE